MSLPLEWTEVEDAVDRGDAAALLARPDEALERVAERGDLFAPVLACVQRLPEG